MADDYFDEEEEPPLDPRITPALFREWRAPRYGAANPERTDKPVWEWLIKAKLSAVKAAGVRRTFLQRGKLPERRPLAGCPARSITKS